MDFSRIHEIFYQSIGGQGNDVTLDGFLSHAASSYRELCSSDPGSQNRRRISYSGIEESRVSFSFILYGEPILNALRIEANTGNLGSLLELLGGTVTAEFEGLPIDEIAKPTRKKISRARETHYSKVGCLGLFFSQDPCSSDIIKRAELHGEKVSFFYPPVTTPVTLQRAQLDESSKQILSAADSITVRNHFHVNDNPERGLGQESCDILQPEKGKYLWAYTMQMMNIENIPGYTFPILEDLFALAQNCFDKSSFRKMEIEIPE